MVAKESEAATKLPVASCLRMPADVHISTLPVGKEQFVVLEEAIEFAQTPTDTGVEERLVSGLAEDFQIIIEVLEGRLHVKQDVGSGGRRRTAVLMSAALDRHGDVVRFRVLESSNNVGIAGWLHDQRRVHIVIDSMRARCILVVVVLVSLAIDGVCRRADVLDAFKVLRHPQSHIGDLGCSLGLPVEVFHGLADL